MLQMMMDWKVQVSTGVPTVWQQLRAHIQGQGGLEHAWELNFAGTCRGRGSCGSMQFLVKLWPPQNCSIEESRESLEKGSTRCKKPTMNPWFWFYLPSGQQISTWCLPRLRPICLRSCSYKIEDGIATPDLWGFVTTCNVDAMVSGSLALEFF